MQSELLSSTDSLKNLIARFDLTSASPQRLFIDLEGNNLSRHGTLSLITLLIENESKVYLLDATQLKREAFTTSGINGLTLKDILESKEISKVFFDVRNDSDALYSLYDIKLDGVEDLQLMEVASRNFSKRCVNGLAKCIERDARISFSEQCEWQRVKAKGRKLFDPALGGSYDVFDERPLSQAMIDYCCQDVTLMPTLYRTYLRKLCDAWWIKVQLETNARISLSQSEHYNGTGRHMALAPSGWAGWSPTPEQRGSRALLENLLGTEDNQSSSATQAKTPSDSDAVASAIDALRGLDVSSVSRNSSLSPNHWTEDDDYGHDDRFPSEVVFEDLTACDSECGYCGKCNY